MVFALSLAAMIIKENNAFVLTKEYNLQNRNKERTVTIKTKLQIIFM